MTSSAPAEYLTPADLLVRGFHLPAPDRKPTRVHSGAHCAITGQPISEGYAVADIVTDATAEFLDCFRGGLDGYVSEAAARCFRSANPRMGNPCARGMLVFEDGTAFLPTIDRKVTTRLPQLLIDLAVPVGRPYWTDLVRQVWPARRGQRMLCILTTDTKKRLWIRARVGALGPRTPVLVHHQQQSDVAILDWGRLVECLDLVESIYALGFAKEHIRRSLYASSKALQTVGLAEVKRLEMALRPWRDAPEFAPALMIAQKPPEDPKEETQPDGRNPVCALDGATQLALL